MQFPGQTCGTDILVINSDKLIEMHILIWCIYTFGVYKNFNSIYIYIVYSIYRTYRIYRIYTIYRGGQKKLAIVENKVNLV